MVRVSILLVSATLLLTADLSAASRRKCEKTSELTSVAPTEAVRVATTIKHCLQQTLHIDVKTRLIQLKNGLPESVRNAVFLEKVCIYNKKFAEYMYSPVSGYIFDGSQQNRRVFTFIPGAWNHNNRGDWKLVPSSDHFFIVAVSNAEHLSVNDVVVDKRRRVLTSTPDFHLVNERVALWVLEPTGDDVYIRNDEFGEYLYAVDGMNYDAERRAVNTWSSDDNGCAGHEQCLWKIKSC